MPYLWTQSSLGSDTDVLSPEEERYVQYELPKKHFELEKARLEQDKKLAPWEVLTGIASGLLPLLTFLGIAGIERARRKS